MLLIFYILERSPGIWVLNNPVNDSLNLSGKLKSQAFTLTVNVNRHVSQVFMSTLPVAFYLPAML
jgi:hypothetical protein